MSLCADLKEPKTENVEISSVLEAFLEGSKGARRGGTEDAPRRHQGGTKEAAGRQSDFGWPPYVVTTLLPTKNEVLKI